MRYIFNARESGEFFKIVKKIIDLIDMEIPNWNRAKTIWILIINKLKHNSSFEFNCWGSGCEIFVKHFEDHQAIQFKCEKCNQIVKKIKSR